METSDLKINMSMQAYTRYADAELRAWFENNTAKAIMLARWKARAYRMYAVSTPYV